MQNKNRKNKKLTEGEGFTLAQDSPLGLSIGALLGASQSLQASEKFDKQAQSADENENRPKDGEPNGTPHAAKPVAAPDEAAAKKSRDGKSTANPDTLPKISKVSLQRQRAGRGGKTVTLVTLAQDYRGDVAALAKEHRKGLGCGSTIEEGKIILQGDIADRAESRNAKKGVTKIIKSA